MIIGCLCFKFVNFALMARYFTKVIFLILNYSKIVLFYNFFFNKNFAFISSSPVFLDLKIARSESLAIARSNFTDKQYIVRYCDYFVLVAQ